MEIAVNPNRISSEEELQIAQQVKADLLEHLYEGCLPGTITGLAISVLLYLDFRGLISNVALFTWLGTFNLMMLLLSALYFSFKKFKPQLSLNSWELAYSFMMTGCALAWVPCIFLMPSNNTIREYLALILLFLATTGYATGTIGQFKLCVVTLFIILLPLALYSFYRGGVFYNIVGAYSVIYMLFLMGINFRSTQWFKDSLKLKLENTLVSYQANHDLLTDLPNQRLLSGLLEKTIESVKDTDKTFALVSFSLNRMEMINNTLGDQAGNTIIQSVATRLKSLSDHKEKTQYILTISRKDTFKIIITPIEEKELDKKIQALFDILQEPFYLKQNGVTITASIGVSIYGKDGTDPETLSTNADAAMLQAKQFGGNRLAYYRSEINAEIPTLIELENDLYSALKRNELRLYYQPLIDTRTHKIVGMESLLRWIHPTRGFVSPVHFIPIAEENGLIIPIGEWIFDEACRQTRHWHDMGYDWLKVAVNVSGKQLQQDNFIDIIQATLDKYQFNSKLLELELTETAILDESIIHKIQQVKSMGLGLAVDDFGTGYSGLSYLKRFAVDKLKIDQSFIRDIPDSNDSITIVSAILAMGKELRIKTLAEGVETVEQLNFLKSKDCDYIQGYYFSKPLDPEAFTQFLKTHKPLEATTE